MSSSPRINESESGRFCRRLHIYFFVDFLQTNFSISALIYPHHLMTATMQTFLNPSRNTLGGKGLLTMVELIEKIQDPMLRAQAEKVAAFHGYLSPGALVGIQMFNIARRVLDFSDGERIFVTSETCNCLPDPFQILAKATIGNKGLRIEDLGKMAVTVNKVGLAGCRVQAVRIVLDPAKTRRFPRLHAWFMKSCRVSHDEAVSILLEAGESVYSWETFEREVPERPRKKIAICEGCGESFIQMESEPLCKTCLEPSNNREPSPSNNPSLEDLLCPRS